MSRDGSLTIGLITKHAYLLDLKVGRGRVA